MENNCPTCVYLGFYEKNTSEYYFDQNKDCLLRAKINIYPTDFNESAPFICLDTKSKNIYQSWTNLSSLKKNHTHNFNKWLYDQCVSHGIIKKAPKIETKIIKTEAAQVIENNEKYINTGFKRSDYSCQFHEWGESKPLDAFPELKEVVKLLCNNDQTWVAGGAAMEWYDYSIETKDIDVYFSTVNAIEKARKTLVKEGFVLQTNSPFGCFDYKKPNSKYLVQLINITFDDLTHILDGFDIKACQIAMSSKGYFLNEDTREDLINKKINIHRWDERPSQEKRTFNRIIKYMNKGFTPSIETIQKVWEMHPANKPKIKNKATFLNELTPPSPTSPMYLSPSLFNTWKEETLKWEKNDEKTIYPLPSTTPSEIIKKFNQRKLK